VLALVGAGLVLTGGGGGRAGSAIRAAAGAGQAGQEVDLDPAAIARARPRAAGGATSASGARPQLVVAVPPGGASDQPAPSTSRSSSARGQTDAQIEHDLAEFRKYLATIPPTTGKRAEVISTGEAAAPFDAPSIVIDVVQAANQIALTPYRWGGGHGAWRDKGYDCSGSVSFALAATVIHACPAFA
jgi:cell wall-associated NlpC family hydrolase